GERPARYFAPRERQADRQATADEPRRPHRERAGRPGVARAREGAPVLGDGRRADPAGDGGSSAAAPGAFEPHVERDQGHADRWRDLDPHRGGEPGDGPVGDHGYRDRNSEGIAGKALREVLSGRERAHGRNGGHWVGPVPGSSHHREIRGPGMVRGRGRPRIDVHLHAPNRGIEPMENSEKRVLLVEDDRFLRRACEASLRQRGLAVTTAADGEEGLRLARSELPDLILLDMLMPKLSGLEVLRALRSDEATRSVPVLILSNSSREQDIAEVTSLGISGYFVKSNLSLQELGELVGRLLEGHRV